MYLMPFAACYACAYFAAGLCEVRLLVFMVAGLLDVLLSRNGGFSARGRNLFFLGGRRMLRAATVHNQTHTNRGEGKKRFHAGELSRKGLCEAMEAFSKPDAAILRM